MAEFVYAGLSGVQLGVESFDLGEGLLLERTYAHLFSPFLVAFAPPPGPKEPHPAPWSAAEGGFTTIESETLEWVRERWAPTGRLLYSHGAFRSVFQAFDAATVAGKTSSSLLAIWGGLEQLFGSGRYRIASSIAAYLCPPGKERLAMYRRVMKLYDARSAAAHTTNEAEPGPLIETYVLMRNALVRMVDEGRVPTKGDLEDLLFGTAMGAVRHNQGPHE